MYETKSKKIIGTNFEGLLEAFQKQHDDYKNNKDITNVTIVEKKVLEDDTECTIKHITFKRDIPVILQSIIVNNEITLLSKTIIDKDRKQMTVNVSNITYRDNLFYDDYIVYKPIGKNIMCIEHTKIESKMCYLLDSFIERMIMDNILAKIDDIDIAKYVKKVEK